MRAPIYLGILGGVNRTILDSSLFHSCLNFENFKASNSRIKLNGPPIHIFYHFKLLREICKLGAALEYAVI